MGFEGRIETLLTDSYLGRKSQMLNTRFRSVLSHMTRSLFNLYVQHCITYNIASCATYVQHCITCNIALRATLHYVQQCITCNIALRATLHYVQHCITCNIALRATMHYLSYKLLISFLNLPSLLCPQFS